jgi:hypothetical protein
VTARVSDGDRAKYEAILNRASVNRNAAIVAVLEERRTVDPDLFADQTAAFDGRL